MPAPILATKLYIPPPGPRVVGRPRLFEQLTEGLNGRLTLVSAPAGFGKTTLVSEWIAGCGRSAAWLSLDEGDNDPVRFLTYFIAALQMIAEDSCKGVLGLLHSPQPPPIEPALTALLNEIAAIPDDFVLVLDDYHLIESRLVDDILGFLLKHLPPRMHLVIATREDPNLPLSRLRARGQLNELRVKDLRFTLTEAGDFLNQVMELSLPAEDVAALETRTEGWIAGLQLAAISMQGHPDATGFVRSFTGSHHFVMDYLVEEVLHQQPEHVQAFLLKTSVLDRLCGPLCDAVLLGDAGSGQEILETLERANLFIIPLDNERRWYRYHHLFADLLRQRLAQSITPAAGDAQSYISELHIRASQWLEDNGMDIDAFHHATAADDLDRAARLVVGNGMPLQFRGGLAPVYRWLASLPTTALDARPSLWVMYASAMSMSGGGPDSVEHALQNAEAALQNTEQDDTTRNLTGHIAAIRALLAAYHYQPEAIIAQSERALEYLAPNNLAVRTATIWKLGLAYQLQGDRDAASRAFTEAMAISESSGNLIIFMSAATGLGSVQESENQLPLAEQTYRRILQVAGDMQPWAACEAHLGLARVFYEWNDLDAAEQHAQDSAQLAPQFVDRSVTCDLLRARLKLARGDAAGADALVAQADQIVRQHHFTPRIPEVAAAQVLTLIRQGNPAAAAQLAQTHHFPLGQARAHLALGDISAALATLGSLREQAESKRWPDEQLKAMILQGIAYQADGDLSKAIQALRDALALAQPGGYVRLFVDEGEPMARLLSEAAAQGIMPDYVNKLLAAFETGEGRPTFPSQPLIDPLSERELEILQLVAEGLSNREIGQKLFLALDTVKGHNRRIYDKLQVQRRTEAVARARDLGLL